MKQKREKMKKEEKNEKLENKGNDKKREKIINGKDNNNVKTSNLDSQSDRSVLYRVVDRSVGTLSGCGRPKGQVLKRR